MKSMVNFYLPLVLLFAVSADAQAIGKKRPRPVEPPKLQPLEYQYDETRNACLNAKGETGSNSSCGGRTAHCECSYGFYGTEEEVVNEDYRGARSYGVKLANQRIRSSRFNGAVIEAAEVDGLTIEKCDFAKARFSGVKKFADVSILDSKFDGAQIQGYGFSHLRFRNVSFRNGSLSGEYNEDAAISGTFQEVDFTSADISGNFAGAVFKKVSFRRAAVKGRGFSEASMKGNDFSEAQLSGDFSGADISSTQLTGALVGGDAREANFSGSNLAGSTFFNLDLRGANLENADLRDAELMISGYYPRGAVDFSLTRMKGAILHRIKAEFGNFSGADLSGAQAHSGQFPKVVFERATLDGADFTGANLREARFTLASLKGAILRNADLTRAALAGADLTGAVFDRWTILPFSHEEALRRGMVREALP